MHFNCSIEHSVGCVCVPTVTLEENDRSLRQLARWFIFTTKVKFVGEGHRSELKVTEENISYSAKSESEIGKIIEAYCNQ